MRFSLLSVRSLWLNPTCRVELSAQVKRAQLRYFWPHTGDGREWQKERGFNNVFDKRVERTSEWNTNKIWLPALRKNNIKLLGPLTIY